MKTILVTIIVVINNKNNNNNNKILKGFHAQEERRDKIKKQRQGWNSHILKPALGHTYSCFVAMLSMTCGRHTPMHFTRR